MKNTIYSPCLAYQRPKSKFKAKALEYMRMVEDSKQPIIITHFGKPVLKVVPYQE